ncbi:MAG: DUF3108 domain-containing protein [Acidobacteriota bacterium]|nr:DUF3108 domain-containing protein [Acidobacteriota bacterium]
MKKFISSIFIALNIFCVSISAQTEPQFQSYMAGESLTYEAKFSKIIKGIAVADLSFAVERATNNRDYLITSNAVTKGNLLKLFNQRFVQKYESTVDGENFSIKRTVKRDEQGDRVRESEALFDYAEKKVIYVETDPNDTARAPRQIASPIQNDTQDMITAIYTLRRLPLAVGKTFDLTVSDSGLVYKVPVHVVARELQKSILGKVWCFRIEPEVFGENRLIEQKGSMILWITDDSRRLPVRSQINANIGRIEVKLKKIKSN